MPGSIAYRREPRAARDAIIFHSTKLDRRNVHSHSPTVDQPHATATFVVGLLKRVFSRAFSRGNPAPREPPTPFNDLGYQVFDRRQRLPLSPWLGRANCQSEFRWFGVGRVVRFRLAARNLRTKPAANANRNSSQPETGNAVTTVGIGIGKKQSGGRSKPISDLDCESAVWVSSKNLAHQPRTTQDEANRSSACVAHTSGHRGRPESNGAISECRPLEYETLRSRPLATEFRFQ